MILDACALTLSDSSSSSSSSSSSLSLSLLLSSSAMPIAAENLEHFLSMRSMVNLGSGSSTISPKAQIFSSSSREDCDEMTVPSTVPPTVPHTVADGIVCNGCGLEIKEKYMMKIDDNCWHENCLICCTCRIPLNGSSCYSRSGQFYCKEDYIV
uniref:LIM zinc-binding domain-containing protein n=1 Tax=Onchocerca volvulus TaxID=6282 RepID=A0A8R1TR32_ONCVO